MTPFHVHPGAREEFDEVFNYYWEIDPELAEDFAATFFRYLGGIVGNPLRYNIRRRAVRRANLQPRFGEYHIAYMIWRQEVVILALAHAKRRPYYWSKRIGEAKGIF